MFDHSIWFDIRLCFVGRSIKINKIHVLFAILFGFTILTWGQISHTVHRKVQSYQPVAEILHFPRDPEANVFKRDSSRYYGLRRSRPTPYLKVKPLKLELYNGTLPNISTQSQPSPPNSDDIKSFQTEQLTNLPHIPNLTTNYSPATPRLQHKRTTCQDVYKTTPPTHLTKEALPGAKLDTTYYNDYFNFFISTSCKAGSTNWRNLMRDLYKSTTIMKVHISDTDFNFASLNASDFNSKIENYYKVIFVRNPLSRFLSAYRNKINDNKDKAYRNKAKDIIKLYRRNATERDIRVGNATFLEFTQYVVEHREDKDPHWYPAVNRLKSCLIPYDFIGKMETIQTDSDDLFKTLHIEELVSLPSIIHNHKVQSGDVDILKIYYASLPDELFQRFLQLYEADFRVFGYRVPKNQTDFRSEEDLKGI